MLRSHDEKKKSKQMLPRTCCLSNSSPITLLKYMLITNQYVA